MVIIISATIQEFHGVRYYRCGPYFQRKGVRLHRAVWESIHGAIPDGFHIHHVDHDRANNEPENLQLMLGTEHVGEHGRDIANLAQIVPRLEQARIAAASWHGSDEGKRWHSEHYERHIRPVMGRTVEKSCQQCGKHYSVIASKAGESKFCHANCKARALRARRKAQRA